MVHTPSSFPFLLSFFHFLVPSIPSSFNSFSSSLPLFFSFLLFSTSSLFPSLPFFLLISYPSFLLFLSFFTFLLYSLPLELVSRSLLPSSPSLLDRCFYPHLRSPLPPRQPSPTTTTKNKRSFSTPKTSRRS
ncbi:MAG: hypothetical protein JOS17DRAFT_491116 [Linnemannia elongata]|nr:MAG: hypothetical protein JOS17DRAFT_491116 [Linnemannia elongata]